MASNEEIHHVRDAVKEDCPQIMALATKLAILHRYKADRLRTSAKDLARDGFSENEHPKFKCLVSHDDNNQISAYLSYNEAYSLWEGRSFFLGNIFVEPQFRRMGIGKKLCARFAQIALAQNISRINLCIQGWNQTSIDFHESLGAVNLTLAEGWNYFKFTEKTIQDSSDNNATEPEKETHHAREAVKDDCHQIMELTKMFARLRNMEDSVKINAETLIRDGFTENEIPKFKCIVSHDDNNQLSGYLIYYYIYSLFDSLFIYVEDFFVGPQFRRIGIGKKILAKLAQVAEANNICLFRIIISAANQSTIDFLESLGAINLTKKDNWYIFGFDEKSIQELVDESAHL